MLSLPNTDLVANIIQVRYHATPLPITPSISPLANPLHSTSANILFILPHLNTTLVINNLLVSNMPSHANILPELARGKLSLEHLVNLFERAVLDLREVEVDPDDGEEA